MRIVYFGTPFFALSILRFLIQSGISVSAVVTKPDRPKGRALELQPPPVKAWLQEEKLSIPVFQPQKCSDPSFLAAMQEMEPDLFVVVAFGQILPLALLKIPKKGAINVHASLLPKYRGAAPIQRSLLSGDKETGVTIQKMALELDAGEVVATARMEIDPNMNAGALEAGLCELAKPLLLVVLNAYRKAVPPSTPQDASCVTYAQKISVEEGEIHWDRPAEEIHNRIRAFAPRPGAWTWCLMGQEMKRVKILETEIIDLPGTPGKFLSREPVVGCGERSLHIRKIQTEGKQALSGEAWLCGFPSLPHFIV
ncbi:MAG: methionyl-tRNA formyltransferase [Verrucomicrobiota bacterium]|nr:methionyl-tRNA formyltransferase [Verrucomicrobiota bacterium]